METKEEVGEERVGLHSLVRVAAAAALALSIGMALLRRTADTSTAKGRRSTDRAPKHVSNKLKALDGSNITFLGLKLWDIFLVFGIWHSLLSSSISFSRSTNLIGELLGSLDLLKLLRDYTFSFKIICRQII